MDFMASLLHRAAPENKFNVEIGLLFIYVLKTKQFYSVNLNLQSVYR